MTDKIDSVKMLRGYYNCGYFSQEDLDNAADELSSARDEIEQLIDEHSVMRAALQGIEKTNCDDDFIYETASNALVGVLHPQLLKNRKFSDPCMCTFNQKMVGDGCHLCNPEKPKNTSRAKTPRKND